MTNFSRIPALLLIFFTALPPRTSSASEPDTRSSPTPDFHTQILPLLTRSGCNAGACHGAAAGRGEFRLSLFAADPAADFQAIAIERQSRRINPTRPERSLLFRKACGLVPHEGGQVLDPDGSEAKRLLHWIRDGAPLGEPKRATTLHVMPTDFTASSAPAQAALTIHATFHDGTSRDVTDFCRITSSDLTALTVSDTDVVTVLRPGQHTLVIRYLNQTQLVRFSIPFTKLTPVPATDTDAPGVESPSTDPNPVDQHIEHTLVQLGLVPSEAASPETWIRRVYLQLAGRLPPVEAVRQLISSDTPQARAGILDQLLASEDFTDFWTLQLASLLQLHSLPNESAAWNASVKWIRTAVASDQPLNEWVTQSLLASGDSHVDGAAGFSRMATDARAHAELVGEAFAGYSLGCANCHNHPLDRWTQDDFHGFAAIFAPLDRGRVVQFTGRGTVTNLRTGEPAVPRIPGLQDLTPGEDHRAAVAKWLTSGTTPPLARNLANRLWKHLFGRGLIEPVNDLSFTNPASHPELLDALAEQIVADGWSLRRTLRRIVLTNTWSRTANVDSSRQNPLQNAETLFLARRRPLPLTPQMLADAIADVCATPLNLAPQEASRAVHVLDPSRPAAELESLGRCSRSGNCSPHSSQPELPLSAQLHLLNGALINQRLSDPDGRLQQLIREDKSDAAIVTEFTLRALSRMPTEEEQNYWQQQLTANTPTERLHLLEDFLWSLLNSQDFRHIP